MRPRLLLTVFIAVFALTLAVLMLVLPEDPGRVAAVLWLSLALALIATSIACLPATFRWAGAVRRGSDPDRDSQRRIARAVVRNDDSHLDDGQRGRAVRYAFALSHYLPVIVTQTGLVLAGVVALQLAGSGRELVPFRTGLVVGVVVAALVLGPILGRQIRAVRRYVREHPVDATAGFEPAK